jgi:hypothetical protein
MKPEITIIPAAPGFHVVAVEANTDHVHVEQHEVIAWRHYTLWDGDSPTFSVEPITAFDLECVNVRLGLVNQNGQVESIDVDRTQFPNEDDFIAEAAACLRKAA